MWKNYIVKSEQSYSQIRCWLTFILLDMNELVYVTQEIYLEQGIPLVTKIKVSQSIPCSGASSSCPARTHAGQRLLLCAFLALCTAPIVALATLFCEGQVLPAVL